MIVDELRELGSGAVRMIYRCYSFWMDIKVSNFSAVSENYIHDLRFGVVGNALEIGASLHRPAHPLICALRLNKLIVRATAS